MTRLERLHQIAEVAWLSRQQELVRLNARDAELLDAIDKLSNALSTRGAEREIDTARRAGADPRWQLWAGRRLAELQFERARLRAQHIQAKAEIGRLFGRAEMTKRLARDAVRARLP